MGTFYLISFPYCAHPFSYDDDDDDPFDFDDDDVLPLNVSRDDAYPLIIFPVMNLLKTLSFHASRVPQKNPFPHVSQHDILC